MLKYGKRLCLLAPLADVMLQAVQHSGFVLEADLLVPVPASWRSLIKRGYNQSALLADSLGRHLGVPVDRSVLKRRGLKPQVGLGRDARFSNAAESFAPGRGIGRAAGKRILLFDDVYTTGATVRTCAGIVQAQGASVSILTFARRAPEYIDHLVMDQPVGSKHPMSI